MRLTVFSVSLMCFCPDLFDFPQQQSQILCIKNLICIKIKLCGNCRIFNRLFCQQMTQQSVRLSLGINPLRNRTVRLRSADEFSVCMYTS